MDAVSFTKGCFLGQELVCRIDSPRPREPVPAPALAARHRAVPPSGAEIAVDGKVVGTITSATRCPVRTASWRSAWSAARSSRRPTSRSGGPAANRPPSSSPDRARSCVAERSTGPGDAGSGWGHAGDGHDEPRAAVRAGARTTRCRPSRPRARARSRGRCRCRPTGPAIARRCRAARTRAAGRRRRCRDRRRRRARSTDAVAPRARTTPPSTSRTSTRSPPGWPRSAPAARDRRRPGTASPRRRRAASTPRSRADGWNAVDRLVDHRAGVDRRGVERELVGVEAGEVEEVGDEALEPARLGRDHLARRGCCSSRPLDGAVGDRLRVPADRRERRAQVVRHAQEERALVPARSRARRPSR